MSCALIGLYVTFVIGGQVTSIPPLCGISSGLLQYFLLVFFAWTTVEAVWIYLKLVKIFGIQSIESKFIMIASLVSWCKLNVIVYVYIHASMTMNTSPELKIHPLPFLVVPVFIVVLSGGVGHTYYTSEY